jgi:20S proteasome subunit alpha 5
VLAVEKRIQSKLLESSSVKKILKLDQHIGCAMSGLAADARTLVDHARVATQQHWFTYDEPIKVEGCVQSVCDLALGFGHGETRAMARPFGVALLIAGVDDSDGPCLYHTDPSGTHTRYAAKAIGAGSEGAQATLQEQYNKSMELHEAKKLALEVLKQVRLRSQPCATSVHSIASFAITGFFNSHSDTCFLHIVSLLSPNKTGDGGEDFGDEC